MCGIVGAVAHRNITPILIEGLRRLEYRGYDSCGLAVHRAGQIERSRSTERVSDLQAIINQTASDGSRGMAAFQGIAHTRWATHGAPEQANAHPHVSPSAQRANVALVHNGIIENYEELRVELVAAGYSFTSRTDTEVIAHLIESLDQGDLFEAVQHAVRRLKGAYAIAVMSATEPQRIVGARFGSPLVVGLGLNENFLASDAMALAGVTSQIAYLNDGDVVDVQDSKVWIVNAEGQEVQRAIQTVQAFTGAAELGPYRHYMQKEIFEQPRAVGDTLEGVERIVPELFGDGAYRSFKAIDSVLILACGTSYYAGLVAKYWIELLAHLPTTVEIASEYRYNPSVPNAKRLVVSITQSGETADTLAALKHARSLGMEHTLTICNVATSAMVRECKLAYITRAGVEIGVASTKAFTTQLTALHLLALTLAETHQRLSEEQEGQALRMLRKLPGAITSALALEPQIMAWAERFASRENALFLGRGLHYPIALEGALKLKEISYIHAEAYPAGELKHGPLALVTQAMPVVTVAPNDALIERLKSNLQEVRARQGELYVFTDNDTHLASSVGIHVIRLPGQYGLLSPIVHTIPLQLLAYHTALARGSDVDKPRNLAKSVTVE
jgi:glutamine---fructose-6-phosphate transaminase (isomerizing)